MKDKLPRTPFSSVFDLTPERGTTPVPTALLDTIMPKLRDTELRLLLVVVRQTLGWQVGKDPYLRKERDWLTQSQLMRRTGRASGAIARAVDALVRGGLIDVLDEAENLLITHAERRRYRGRLYYRLHRQDKLATNGRNSSATVKSAAVKSAAVKRKHVKANITTKTVYKNRDRWQRGVDKTVEKPLVIRGDGWVQAKEIVAKQTKKQSDLNGIAETRD